MKTDVDIQWQVHCAYPDNISKQSNESIINFLPVLLLSDVPNLNCDAQH